MKEPTAADYLAILKLYGDALQPRADRREPDLALAFEQVLRLLRRDSDFNQRLPAPFRDVAWRYQQRDPATLAHFHYDENRQFFLSDLYDLVRLRTLQDARRAESE